MSKEKGFGIQERCGSKMEDAGDRWYLKARTPARKASDECRSIN